MVLLCIKNVKLGIRLEKKICWQNLAETDRGSYSKEERSVEFLDSKGAFYNSNQSDNDDESYNENNEQQQSLEGFANSYCEIVSPIDNIATTVQTFEHKG